MKNEIVCVEARDGNGRQRQSAYSKQLLAVGSGYRFLGETDNDSEMYSRSEKRQTGSEVNHMVYCVSLQLLAVATVVV